MQQSVLNAESQCFTDAKSKCFRTTDFALQRFRSEALQYNFVIAK